jgi:hypothetical protein
VESDVANGRRRNLTSQTNRGQERGRDGQIPEAPTATRLKCEIRRHCDLEL